MNKFLNNKGQVAHKLNVSYDTVTNLIDQGHIKTILVGRRHFVSNAEIDRFLATLKSA